MTKTTAVAKVQITLEVNPGSIWGGDCPLDQVYKQAAEGAVNIISRIIKGHGMVSIVGTPKVLNIVTEKE